MECTALIPFLHLITHYFRMLTAPWLQSCLQKVGSRIPLCSTFSPREKGLAEQLYALLKYVSHQHIWLPAQTLNAGEAQPGHYPLFITQRRCVRALPLTSFPTDNIRQHALHTHVFNCLLGFWILTHNLCPQLLVSHFSFVLSFTQMCFCLRLSRCLQNTDCKMNTDVQVREHYVNFSAESKKLNER